MYLHEYNNTIHNMIFRKSRTITRIKQLIFLSTVHFQDANRTQTTQKIF